MKKRTKKKIHNRIIKKLISGQTLSGFDKKYHEEMIRKVYVTKPKHRVYAENKLIATIDEEPSPVGTKVRPSVDGHSPKAMIIDELADFSSQSDVTNLTWIAKDEHQKIHSLISDSTISVQKASEILKFDSDEIEPSKWQKITSKVKGWFSK